MHLVCIVLICLPHQRTPIAGPHFYFYVWLFLCVVSIIMMTIYPTLIAPLFNKYAHGLQNRCTFISAHTCILTLLVKVHQA